MRHTRSKTLFLLSFVFVLFCASAKGFASEKHSTLTEDNVTAFIEETTKLTSGHNLNKSSEEIIAYLDRHLDKNARFKSTMTYNVPGFPPQQNAISLDKDEFIDYVQEGANSLEDYDNEINVDKVRISKDGTRATVQTSSFETGSMSVNGRDGGQEVPVEGVSNCLQILKLHRGVIQMYSANCSTEIQFQQF